MARPNVILMIADGVGFGDLGSYGHPEARRDRAEIAEAYALQRHPAGRVP